MCHKLGLPPDLSQVRGMQHMAHLWARLSAGSRDSDSVFIPAVPQNDSARVG